MSSYTNKLMPLASGVLRLRIRLADWSTGDIGAPVAFGPNPVRPMRVLSNDVYDAYKSDVWFDFLNGAELDSRVGITTYLFQQKADRGISSVYRAHLVDELVKHLPRGATHFRKHLDTVEEPSTIGGTLKLFFRDGTAVEEWISGGDDKAEAHSVQTHHYAFRGLVPMQQAVDALGGDSARNAKM